VAGAGQATVGRYAGYVAKNFEGETGKTAKRIHGAADSLSKASFDPRNMKIPDVVPVVGGTAVGAKVMSGISQATGVKIDAGKDASFVQSQKAEKDKKKKERLEDQRVQERVGNENALETARALPTGSAALMETRNASIQSTLKRFSGDDILGMKGDMLPGINAMVAAKAMKEGTPEELVAKRDAISAARTQLTENGTVGNLDQRGVKTLVEQGDLTEDQKAVVREETSKNKSNLSGNKYYKEIQAEEDEAEVKNTIVPKIDLAISLGNLAELRTIMDELKSGQLQHFPAATLANPAVAGLLTGKGIEEIARNITKMGTSLG